MSRTVLTLLVTLLAALPIRADHAVLAGGRQVEGTLRLDRSAVLAFTRIDGGAVPLADVRSFRLSDPPPAVPHGPGHLVRLSADEAVAGEFLTLRDDRLHLRTGWADRLAVPRAGTLSLTHLPGWRTVRRDDLSAVPAGVHCAGEPAFTADGVRLGRADQSLTWPVRPAIAEGRIGVTWQEDGDLAGLRTAVELTFAAKGGDRTLRVVLTGADRHLTTEGITGTFQPVPRTATSRRLVVTITTGSVRVTADDAVVAYTLTEGPGGPLRQVRLACSGDARTGQGTVRFARYALETSAAWPPRPPAEPGQDELWLASGDQAFGRVTRADAGGIDLQSRLGERRLAWSELLGWYPRRVAAPPPPAAGATVVRLELHSPFRPERDVLIGTLVRLDARHAHLRHPLLGDLTLPRSHLATLRFAGDR